MNNGLQRKTGRVLRFVVSGALLVAGPVACGGSAPTTHTNEPHVNEPAHEEPTSNEPAEQPQQSSNEPPQEQPAVAPES